MSFLTNTSHDVRPVDGGFFDPFVRWGNAIAERVRRYNEYARAEASLQSLSDHELNDIGIARDAIHRRVWADFDRA